MGNRRPEADLVANFKKIITARNKISDDHWFSANCNARNRADIEYVNSDGYIIVAEVKVNTTSDNYNGIHKIFGNLLKETGRKERKLQEAREKTKVDIKGIKYGLIIPNDPEAISFFRENFRFIDRNVFAKFGELLPIELVFCCDKREVCVYSWMDFYDGKNPVQI